MIRSILAAGLLGALSAGPAAALSLSYTGAQLANDPNAVLTGFATQVGTTDAADFGRNGLTIATPFDVVIYRLRILEADPTRTALDLSMTLDYAPSGTSDSDPGFGIGSSAGYRIVLRQDTGPATGRSGTSFNGPADPFNYFNGGAYGGYDPMTITFSFGGTSTSASYTEDGGTTAGSLPAFDPSAALDFVITHNNNNDEIYRISSLTIEGTETFSSVPLPAPALLLAGGLLGLAGLRRRGAVSA